MGDLTVGIIGLGAAGRHHADRLDDIGHAVVGMDIDEIARKRFVDRFGAPTVDDHHALLEAADAVVVATPNDTHERYATDALDDDLDVLVEKPLADSLEAASRIARAAAESDGFCTVGYHNRYRSVVERFKQLHDEGRFGEITHVRASNRRRRGVPVRREWVTRRDVAGGGALIDIGAHTIDLALHLLGFPPIETVSGRTHSPSGSRFEVEAAARGFISCADGSTVAVDVAWQTNGPSDKELVVDGDERGAVLVPGADRLEVIEEGVRTRIGVDPGDPYERELRSFVRGVETGVRPDRNGIDEALTVQRVIHSIYRSADRSGRPLPVTGTRTVRRRPPGWYRRRIGVPHLGPRYRRRRSIDTDRRCGRVRPHRRVRP